MVEIVQKEDPVLRKKAKNVLIKDITSPKIVKLITKMKKAVEQEIDGVAIAAPQVGEALRIFVVSHRAFEIEEVEEHAHSAQDGKANDMVFINPEITKLSRDKAEVEEGCLSVRWWYGRVKRSNKATIQAYDEHGHKFQRGGSGLLAQIFQHEVDHLEGVLFIDKATELEEIMPEKNAL